MNVLLASFPILMVVVTMLVFGLPAKRALPLGWLATVVVAIGYWRQNAVTALAWALDGFLESAGVLSVVFGSILVMNTLALSPVIAEDAVFAFCIQSEVFDLFEVNRILYEQGLKIIPPK